jgi:hypothetical protein
LADYHTFKIAGRLFLFFPRSARLFELDQTAEQMLGKFCDPVAKAGSAELDPTPAAGFADSEEAATEFRQLLRQELALPPPRDAM